MRMSFNLVESRRKMSQNKPGVEPETNVSEDSVEAFGADFVASMRQESALNPRSLRALDVVDVFSDIGQFMLRGLVESREGAHVHVKADPAQGAEMAEAVVHQVPIHNCRFADALPPPANLKEWEAARGVDSSKPPL